MFRELGRAWLENWWQRHMGKKMEAMSGTARTATHQCWPGYSCSLSAASANSSDGHWAPDMAPLLGVTCQRPGDRLTTLAHFLRKGPHFVLTGVHTCSGYGFVFPACNSSAQATICGLHTALFLTRTSLHRQRSATVSPHSWTPLVLPCALPSCSSWPDRKTEWAFEDTVTAPMGQQQPGGLGHGSPEGGICSESTSNIGRFFRKHLYLTNTAGKTGSTSSRINRFTSITLNKN